MHEFSSEFHEIFPQPLPANLGPDLVAYNMINGELLRSLRAVATVVMNNA